MFWVADENKSVFFHMQVKEHKRGNINKQKCKCVMKWENRARKGPLDHGGNDAGQTSDGKSEWDCNAEENDQWRTVGHQLCW